MIRNSIPMCKTPNLRFHKYALGIHRCHTFIQGRSKSSPRQAVLNSVEDKSTCGTDICCLGWASAFSTVPSLLLANAVSAAPDASAPNSWLSTDALISVAFTVAVVALGAVTIGVLYLSLSTWNDSRTEKAEREKFEKAFKQGDAYGGGEERVKKKKQVAARGPSKGFGK